MRATAAVHRSRGFTLVELLIALALLAVLATLSWRGIDGMARTIDYTRSYGNAVQTLQVGLAQWTTDLDAVEAPVPTLTMEWNGKALRMTRRDAGGQGWYVVAWTLRDSAQGPRWLRWQSQPVALTSELQLAWAQAALWSQGQDAALQERETAVAPIESWQIYFFRGNSWSNPQSSAGATNNTNSGEANSGYATPDGVRLILNLPADHPLAGRVTRDWVRPTLGGSQS